MASIAGRPGSTRSTATKRSERVERAPEEERDRPGNPRQRREEQRERRAVLEAVGVLGGILGVEILPAHADVATRRGRSRSCPTGARPDRARARARPSTSSCAIAIDARVGRERLARGVGRGDERDRGRAGARRSVGSGDGVEPRTDRRREVQAGRAEGRSRTGVHRSGAVVLPDAHRHDALQQANLLARYPFIARTSGSELHMSFSDDEQVLGKDVSRARLGGDEQQRRLKRARVPGVRAGTRAAPTRTESSDSSSRRLGGVWLESCAIIIAETELGAGVRRAASGRSTAEPAAHATNVYSSRDRVVKEGILRTRTRAVGPPLAAPGAYTRHLHDARCCPARMTT